MEGRYAQLKQILKNLDKDDDIPTIVAGDFNTNAWLPYFEEAVKFEEKLREEYPDFYDAFDKKDDWTSCTLLILNKAKLDWILLKNLKAPLLFSIDKRFQRDLDKKRISNDLKQELQSKGITNTRISIVEKGRRWLLIQENNRSKQIYTVDNESVNGLNVYKPRGMGGKDYKEYSDHKPIWVIMSSRHIQE